MRPATRQKGAALIRDERKGFSSDTLQTVRPDNEQMLAAPLWRKGQGRQSRVKYALKGTFMHFHTHYSTTTLLPAT